MAYYFYLGKTLLPVAPSKLTLKIGGQNKTYNLINDGEINVLKSASLTEIEFDALLPNVQYGFAVYKNGYQPAEAFLNAIETLKKSKLPFQFIVTRASPNGKMLFDTNMKVSLENYNIVEESKNGLDVTVSIKLKQYKEYGTKTAILSITQRKTTAKVKNSRNTSTAPSNGLPTTYTVKKGDCLSVIAKKFYGSGSKTYYMKIANANGISNPNLIYPNQVFTIPV